MATAGGIPASAAGGKGCGLRPVVEEGVKLFAALLPELNLEVIADESRFRASRGGFRLASSRGRGF